MDIISLLVEGSKLYNINLSEVQINQFLTYMKLLKEWNKKINLTAITEDDEIVKKHFLDSISIFETGLINGDSKVIDVGTGAGFPGIPIKIINPSVDVTLLDSLNKRLLFLNDVIEKLNLKGIKTVHGRAEDMGKDKEYREKYDIATARAVANMTMLSEYCIPYVRIGGHFIALKGPSANEECVNAKNAIGTLGGKFVKIQDVEILQENIEHKLCIVKKVKETQSKYPRKSSQIEKKPLV